MKRNVRHSKYDPYIDEVDLIQANPHYAHVRLSDGHETTILTKQLALTGTHKKFIGNENVIENI